jgi:nitroimidazol reductase NimA-like FMN-containing flavoprotein (pyridoxamine 5'-phosphate oxidase superfamily)
MEVARMACGGPELLNDPVAQQLLASTIPARIAYVWRDGSPRITSLWFHWTGTDIVFATFKGAPKLNALHTGDQIALTIDTEAPPNHLVSRPPCARSAWRPSPAARMKGSRGIS